MSKAASVLNRGDRVATFRCDPRFMIVSSDRTTRQVDYVPHADPVGDFPQSRAAGREETAHQTIAAELVHPVLPALGAQTQPLEDPGQLLRDRGFSLAKANRTNSSFSLVLQPVLEPLLAVENSLAQQECLANTARHAVISARYRHINQFRSGDRHLGNLLGV
jgi:hypothetical protein